jgi:hypothetical protein
MHLYYLAIPFKNYLCFLSYECEGSTYLLILRDLLLNDILMGKVLYSNATIQLYLQHV